MYLKDLRKTDDVTKHPKSEMQIDAVRLVPGYSNAEADIP